MITGSGIAGRAEVGAIVCTPGPGVLKSIVSGPGVALEASIACRRVSVPDGPDGSTALVTVNVASSSQSSTNSKDRLRGRFRLRLRIRRLTRLNSFMSFPSESRHEEEPGLQPTGERPTTSRPDLPRRTHRCRCLISTVGRQDSSLQG